MYSTGRLLAVVALGFGLAGQAHASASLVADINFDGPSGGRSFVAYSDDASMGPWQVTASELDLIGSCWRAPIGMGGSVDLDGNASGGIADQRAAMAGQLYQLSFDLSGNADGSPPPSRLGFSAETFSTTAHDAVGSNAPPSSFGDIVEAFRFQ